MREDVPDNRRKISHNFSPAGGASPFVARAIPTDSASVVPVSVASGDPLALDAAVKRKVQALDPDQPVSSISTMEKNTGASLADVCASFLGKAFRLSPRTGTKAGLTSPLFFPFHP
jgi:hypothetical protein